MDHEDDDPGITWNERAAYSRRRPHEPAPGLAGDPGGLPKEAIISSDIGNNCAIGNAYPTFEARPQVPGAGPVRSLRLRLPRRSSAPRSAARTCPVRRLRR